MGPVTRQIVVLEIPVFPLACPKLQSTGERDPSCIALSRKCRRRSVGRDSRSDDTVACEPCSIELDLRGPPYRGDTERPGRYDIGGLVRHWDPTNAVVHGEPRYLVDSCDIKDLAARFTRHSSRQQPVILSGPRRMHGLTEKSAEPEEREEPIRLSSTQIYGIDVCFVLRGRLRETHINQESPDGRP